MPKFLVAQFFSLLAVLCLTLPFNAQEAHFFGIDKAALCAHSYEKAAHSAAGCQTDCPGIEGIAEDHFSYIPPATIPSTTPSARSAVLFSVDYTGFPQPAIVAFQYAVNIWSELIDSSQLVEIEANWEDLPGETLGSASPTGLAQNFAGAGFTDTYYPIALANSIAGNDLSSDVDIACNFDSGSPWYFGTDGNVPPGQYDFVTVVLHELGHGLGIIGSALVVGNTGFLGSGGTPYIYDRFVVTATGDTITEVSQGTAVLATALTSGGLYWAGQNGVAAATAPPGIYAPSNWESGASFSHLREDMYLSGTPNSLMTPQLYTGEAIHNPGPIIGGMMSDMGWGIQGCFFSNLELGPQIACNPQTNTYSQQITLTYNDPPAGLLNINGSLYVISGSPQTITLSNLTSDGALVDVTAYFTGDPECSFLQAAVFTAPSPCSGGNCAITDLVLDEQSACNPSDGLYDQALTLSFDFSGEAGDVVVNGVAFAVFNNSAEVLLEDLVADGAPVTLLVEFTADNSCTAAFFDAFTAPAACPCSLSAEVVSVGDCDPLSNTFDASIELTVLNPPFNGTLQINGVGQGLPASGTIITAQMNDLPSDGQPVGFQAQFTNLPSCAATLNPAFTAPVSCFCPGDLDGDGFMGVSDILGILAQFGCNTGDCAGDVDGDGVTGVSDILLLLAAYGTGCS